MLQICKNPFSTEMLYVGIRKMNFITNIHSSLWHGCIATALKQDDKEKDYVKYCYKLFAM